MLKIVGKLPREAFFLVSCYLKLIGKLFSCKAFLVSCYVKKIVGELSNETFFGELLR